MAAGPLALPPSAARSYAVLADASASPAARAQRNPVMVEEKQSVGLPDVLGHEFREHPEHPQPGQRWPRLGSANISSQAAAVGQREPVGAGRSGGIAYASWTSSKRNCTGVPYLPSAKGWKYLDVIEYGRGRAGATQEAIR